MPRKSAAALAVVSLVPGQGRPEPPADLDLLEQRIWRDVVAALPGHWVDPAGQVVFRRLAAQAAVAERQEMRLRQLRTQEQDDQEEAAELTIAMAPWPRPSPNFSLSCALRRDRVWYRARPGYDLIKLPSPGPGRSRPHDQAQAKTIE